MPRSARIDAPGALHHIIARGIGRRRIFNKELWSRGKHRHIVRARSLLCYWAVNELDMSMSALAQRFEVSATAISKSVLRGKAIAKEQGLELEQIKV